MVVKTPCSCRPSQLRGGKNNSRYTYSGLDNVVGAYATPLDVAGVPLIENFNGLVVDVKLSVLGVDVALKAAVYGVVLEHVNLHFLAIRGNSERNDTRSTDHVVQFNEGTVEQSDDRYNPSRS